MKAALLVSHGSHSPKAAEEVARLVEKLKATGKIAILEYAFLEIAAPSIPEGIDLCAKKGAGEIHLLLNFFNSGKHVDEDIPALVRAARNKYPEITFTLSSPIGQHPQIGDLFVDWLN